MLSPSQIPGGLPAGAHVSYAPEPSHNGAAIASVVCAAIWPLGLALPGLVTLITGQASQPWIVVGLIVPLCILTAPALGMTCGVVGFARALKYPRLHGSRWLAFAGLAFGFLWFIATLLISDAGPVLVNWLGHL